MAAIFLFLDAKKVDSKFFSKLKVYLRGKDFAINIFKIKFVNNITPSLFYCSTVVNLTYL